MTGENREIRRISEIITENGRISEKKKTVRGKDVARRLLGAGLFFCAVIFSEVLKNLSPIVSVPLFALYFYAEYRLIVK